MAGKTHRIGKSIIEIQKTYGAEPQCLVFLEMQVARRRRVREMRRQENLEVHNHERQAERFSKTQAKVVEVAVPARHLYTCLNAECGHQFSVVAGTVFNDSHLPLRKWFEAIALMLNRRASPRSKWSEPWASATRPHGYLCHRIRKAMDEGVSLFDGIVEVDETYVGGKYDRAAQSRADGKQPVFGLIQRGSGSAHSRVRAFPLPNTSAKILTGAVKATSL